jgi:hypothetical protein
LALNFPCAAPELKIVSTLGFVSALIFGLAPVLVAAAVNAHAIETVLPYVSAAMPVKGFSFDHVIADTFVLVPMPVGLCHFGPSPKPQATP